MNDTDLDPCVTTKIIGIDCAAQPSNFGLAYAHLDSSARLQVTKIERGTEQNNDFTKIAETISDWMAGNSGPTLLAVDAPLGWPIYLKKALIGHCAGKVLVANDVQVDGNYGHYLFRRHTDRFIADLHSRDGRRLGPPLDVGADRIARVARSAVELLNQIETGHGKVPLVWSLEELHSVGAIEVYPRLTLHTLFENGLKGYKSGKESKEKRKRIVARLQKHVEIIDVNQMAHRRNSNDFDHNCIDAVLCVMAGLSFLCGSSVGPAHRRFKQWLKDSKSPSNAKCVARQEGWIWFHKELLNT